MPLTGLNLNKPEKPNATVGDAINYAGQNPPPISYAIAVVRWCIGFFAALFAPSRPKQ